MRYSKLVKRERLLILDGNALVHRAYHAVPATLKTAAGESTNAVFGFASSLLSAIDTLKPTHIVACFDPKGKTFRHQEYSAYKAHRPHGGEDLYSQLERSKELVAAFGIPMFEVSGYEADDAIGTIVKKLKNKPIEIVIATGDKDALQLLSDQVKVWTLKQGIKNSVLYDLNTLKTEKNLTPAGFLLAKALRGDPSDNIPGVTGIGEVTANKIGARFSTPKELIKALKTLSPLELKEIGISESVKERVLANEGVLEQSFKLVTINPDVPIKFSLSRAEFSGFNLNKVIQAFRELEFSSLIARIPRQDGRLFDLPGERKSPQENCRYQTVTKENFEAILKKLSLAKTIALDTETDSLDPIGAGLVGLAIAILPNEAFYFPFGHKDGLNLPKEYLHQLLNALPEEVEIVGQNLKFDLHVLAGAKAKVHYGSLFDTMVAAHILDPSRSNISLSDLAFIEFGERMQPISELIGSGKNQKSMDQVDIEIVTTYCGSDADFALRLYNLFKPKIEKSTAKELFYKVEMPLLPILLNMEQRGIKIDAEKLSRQGRFLRSGLKKLEDEIYKLAGEKFNLNSPAQLSNILFNKLNLQSLGLRRKTHGPSTAVRELEKLKNLHPIIRKIMEYREKVKLVSTYIDTLPKLINPKTGRVHTSFSQTTVSTGRLSSSNPNLQNIPIKTPEGRAIREAFVADRGNILLSADYSQIELRVVAHLSHDPELIRAFKNGIDIHTWTASQLFGVPKGNVSSDQRRTAKAINFSIIYGVSAFGLAENAGIDRHEAARFIDRYFTVFKGVKRYMEERIRMARENGYAESLLGLRLPIQDIHNSQANMQRYAERLAINMPAQGTAAEILKLAMLNLDTLPEANLLLTVHDELVFEVKKGEEKRAGRKIKEIMEGAIRLEVPLVAEVKVGQNWGEMEELKL